MPTQQETVYAAERLVDNGPVFADVAAVQSRLNALRDTWWWEKWCPNVLHVEVEAVRDHKHGRTAAGCAGYLGDGIGRIELHRSTTITERLVVHELTHIIAGARCGSRSHDPWFARVYLELTYLIRGSVAYQQLKQAFDTLGVDYDAEGLAPR
jgi:hypothetical protein